jgi:hypothetical protein
MTEQTADTQREKGLLDRDAPLAPGQKPITDQAMDALWDSASFDVGKEVPGSAVHRIDLKAAAGDETARTLLWALAVEGAAYRLREGEPAFTP